MNRKNKMDTKNAYLLRLNIEPNSKSYIYKTEKRNKA